jgi:hypothetical protein
MASCRAASRAECTADCRVAMARTAGCTVGCTAAPGVGMAVAAALGACRVAARAAGCCTVGTWTKGACVAWAACRGGAAGASVGCTIRRRSHHHHHCRATGILRHHHQATGTLRHRYHPATGVPGVRARHSQAGSSRCSTPPSFGRRPRRERGEQGRIWSSPWRAPLGFSAVPACTSTRARLPFIAEKTSRARAGPVKASTSVTCVLSCTHALTESHNGNQCCNHPGCAT